MDPARKIAVKVNGDILISIKFLWFFFLEKEEALCYLFTLTLQKQKSRDVS